jgi:hypothetical protein
LVFQMEISRELPMYAGSSGVRRLRGIGMNWVLIGVSTAIALHSMAFSHLAHTVIAAPALPVALLGASLLLAAAVAWLGRQRRTGGIVLPATAPLAPAAGFLDDDRAALAVLRPQAGRGSPQAPRSPPSLLKSPQPPALDPRGISVAIASPGLALIHRARAAI